MSCGTALQCSALHCFVLRFKESSGVGIRVTVVRLCVESYTRRIRFWIQYSFYVLLCLNIVRSYIKLRYVAMVSWMRCVNWKACSCPNFCHDYGGRVWLRYCTSPSLGLVCEPVHGLWCFGDDPGEERWRPSEDWARRCAKAPRHQQGKCNQDYTNYWPIEKLLCLHPRGNETSLDSTRNCALSAVALFFFRVCACSFIIVVHVYTCCLPLFICLPE